jgi:hypothetical protein
MESLNLFEQNRPIDQPMFPDQPYAISQPRIKDKGLIEYQLSSDQKLANLKRSLIGGYYDKKMKDKNGSPLFIKTGQQIMNESLADLFINTILEATSGKEVYQSIMNDNDLLAVSKDITDVLIRKLWNRELRVFGSVDKKFIDFIKASLENTVLFLIRRSLNGETNKQLNTNISISENTMQANQSKPNGRGISAMFGGGQ